jgi:hypothetical protein
MNTKWLLSLGSTLAATKFAQGIANLEAEDVLGVVGLSRRRSYLLENLGLIGLGALAGAGAALLFAPARGSETRERIASEFERVKDQTVEALRDAKRQAPGMLRQFEDTAKNEIAARTYNHNA